jgi:hypothetical protein
MDKFFFGDEDEESEEEKEDDKSSIKLDVIKEASERSYNKLGITGTGTGGGGHNYKEKRPSNLFITPNPIA